MVLVSVCLCIIPAVRAIKRAGLFSIVFIMPCVSLISKGASAIALDLGTYVSELGFTTWNVYSAPLYFLCLAVFFAFLNMFISLQMKSFEANSYRRIAVKCDNFFYEVIPCIGILMAAYLVVDMLLSGVPLLSNGSITRFNFWDTYSRLPQAELVSNFITVVSVALGFIYASSLLDEKSGNRCIILVVVFICVRFLLGYKVSGISDLVIGFAVGYLLRRYTTSELPTNSFAKAIKYLISVCAIAVCSYLAWQLASGSASSLIEAIDLLIERQFSLSSHMWWSVVEEGSDIIGLFPNDMSELSSVLEGKTEFSTDIGVYGLMDRYAQDIVFANYVSNGVRFGACFITVSLFYNGILITIAMVVFNAFALSIFLRLFLADAACNRILSFAVLYRIFIVFSSYLTASGTLVSFYRPNMLILVLVYIFLRLVENQINQKRSARHSMSGNKSMRVRGYGYGLS